MADNHLENVEFLMKGYTYSVSQLGIYLIQQADKEDPVVEAVLVLRRKSGLLEAEATSLRDDALAKMAEHLTLRSNFESANQNAMFDFEYEDEDYE